MSSDTIMQLNYSQTERVIQHGQIKQNTTYYSIILKPNELIVRDKHYPLTQIYDISYRHLSSSLYLFYLYTASGVLTFNTYENPKHFKEAVQTQIKTNLFL
ncbi:hypothetical protein SAMN05421734_10224 [Pelagirhabdus alkalitolerans]|uniref:PH domain-containing protein n=1 Tax=Pelagirhabdus alkalitolerans TaxID=1612202 RepID=A0A1G6GXY0_9BACI|nr:hypothetical protein [Pelagirhabdus alkalitolerans]SDB86887.1 hypothetical protein SAMN05421734_10224 [Pelagirhabdus alkalitolerans]